MNFYKHHIGDYAAATSHLSILEDGVFSRLLRVYYRDERPLPADVKAVQRLVGARSRDERAAVEVVLSEFFSLEADGWRNKRADEEIAESQGVRAEAEARRRNETERKRIYRERRSALFAKLREYGVVPAFDTSTDALESLLEQHVSRGTDTGRPADGDADGTATHSPYPISKSKSITTAGHDSSPGDEPALEPTDRGRACRLMRQAGCPLQQLNPSHPDLLAALAEGVTPEALADTVREALACTPPKAKPFTWAIATARGRLEESRAKPSTAGAVTHAPAGPKPGAQSLVDRAAQRAARIFATDPEPGS